MVSVASGTEAREISTSLLSTPEERVLLDAFFVSLLVLASAFPLVPLSPPLSCPSSSSCSCSTSSSELEEEELPLEELEELPSAFSSSSSCEEELEELPSSCSSSSSCYCSSCESPVGSSSSGASSSGGSSGGGSLAWIPGPVGRR